VPLNRSVLEVRNVAEVGTRQREQLLLDPAKLLSLQPRREAADEVDSTTGGVATNQGSL